MPNRIIKESICTSANLDRLSPEEETLFYRILVNCDDFGRMDARAPIIRSKCFPLRTDKVTNDKVKQWLDALVKEELLIPYESEGQPYLLITTWERHQQIRTHRAKFPAPPDDILAPREHSLPDEQDIEDLIYAHLSKVKTFNGEPLLTVDRQVRVGESYLDIVAKGSNTYVFEVKRGRLTNKGLAQLSDYIHKCPGRGLLIGSGLAANFEYSNRDLAVITYDADSLAASIIYRPSWLTTTSAGGMLFNVKSRDNMLASNPIQSNPNPIRIQSEAVTTTATALMDSKLAAFIKIYGDNIGVLTGMISDQLKDLADDYSVEWFTEAVKEACGANVRRLNYITRILERWQVDGFKSTRKKAGNNGHERKGLPGNKAAGAFDNLENIEEPGEVL